MEALRHQHYWISEVAEHRRMLKQTQDTLIAECGIRQVALNRQEIVTQQEAARYSHECQTAQALQNRPTETNNLGMTAFEAGSEEATVVIQLRRELYAMQESEEARSKRFEAERYLESAWWENELMPS